MSQQSPSGKFSKRWRAYFFLLLSVVCWGIALPIVKPALSYVSPSRYLFYRYILAMFPALVIMYWYWPHFSGDRASLWKRLQLLLKISVIELLGTTISLGLLYLGLAYSSVIVTGLISNTYPIFVTIGGLLWLKEREEQHEWIGTFIAFSGALGLILLPAFSGNGHVQIGSMIGNGFLLGHLISNAAYTLWIKRAYHHLPKLVPAAMSCIVGAISFGALSLWEVGGSVHLLGAQLLTHLSIPSVVIAAGYMGIFGTLIGLTAFIKGQDGIEVSEASLFGYLQPLVYIPLSVMYLGERFSLVEALLLGIVLAGVIIAEKRHKRRTTSRTTSR